MNERKSVWVVGDWHCEEFAEPIRWLQGAARCVFLAEVSAPLPCSSEFDGAPAAILIVQSRPGQFSRSQIERLHAAEPLARLVALVGAWCEGEERTGRPWPGVVRVPVLFWHCRLAMELRLEPDGQIAVPWPRTVTPAEGIEAKFRVQAGTGNPRVQRGLAAVYASSKPRFDAISDRLALMGIQAIWSSKKTATAEAPYLTVIDGWDQRANIVPSADEKEIPPRVLLLHFPRRDDYARAKIQRIDVILSLPFLLCDLAIALRQLPRCALTAPTRQN